MAALRVTFEEAPAAIRAALSPAGVRVVGITGPVGAGKSLLAASLSGCVLSTDNYLPDYEGVAEAERDEPRHADFETLAANIRELRQGRGTLAPMWSFQTHRREGARLVAPHALVVVEGIHALHEGVVAHVDLGVFVEAPTAVRWERWAHLESSGQRGWGVEKARVFFENVAEPTYRRYERVYRDRAGIVVVNDRGVPGA